jgi:hypothetical protein
VTEQQLARMAKRRLAILHHAEEITGNVALTCRYYGISRQCFYTARPPADVAPDPQPGCHDHPVAGVGARDRHHLRPHAADTMILVQPDDFLPPD